MPSRPFILSLLVVVSVLCSGCCWRKSTAPACCPPLTSQRVPLSVSPKPDGAGVEASFDALPKYETIKQSMLAQVAADGVVAIDLDEVVCLAAQNSPLAEVIDQQRQLLNCQEGRPCEKTALDIALQGESLEQRNTVAGAAGELFLGLVQVSLQLELLDEADAHLDELEVKIDAADEAGFATAEGKNELEKGRLELQKQQSELDSVHQQLTWQLNMLLNPGADTATVFQPVHHLDPRPVTSDVRRETLLAQSNRPGVKATEMALSADRDGLVAYQLLQLFDKRLGVKVDARPIKKRLLRNQIIEMIRLAEKSDPTAHNRRQQAERIVELRKREAAVSAGKALLDRQTAFEKLTVIQADIERLEKRAKLLAASKDIDAKDVYLKENENWFQRQKARSERVSAAIDYEIADLKLRQAQGTLVQECGFELEFDPSACVGESCGQNCCQNCCK